VSTIILPEVLVDAEDWLRRAWYDSTDELTRIQAQQIREAMQRHRDGFRAVIPRGAQRWLTTACVRLNVHALVIRSWLSSEGILPKPESARREVTAMNQEGS